MLFTGLVLAAAVKVEVRGSPGSFQLYRGGEPYFVQGAGGDHSWQTLHDLGGNAQRTWGSDNAGNQLADAERIGITVLIGIWLNDVNVNDANAKQAQVDQVLNVVRAHKGSSAVLGWGIGNEQELNHASDFASYFKHINNICVQVKKEDPDHICVPVIAECPKAKADAMKSAAPDVDVWGVNAYAGGPTLFDRWSGDLAMNKPFLITEFGPQGQWETAKQFDKAVEVSSDEKARYYEETYKGSVAAGKGKYCVGSFAFLWGDKVEETPYWFGMFLPTGERLQQAETMSRLWNGGTLPAGLNRCPVVQSLTLDKDQVAVNGEIKVTLTTSDPDGDALTYDWLVIVTDGSRNSDGTIPMVGDAITAGAGTKTPTIQIPKAGVYRVYCFIRDGKGNAATATALFKVG